MSAPEGVPKAAAWPPEAGPQVAKATSSLLRHARRGAAACCACALLLTAAAQAADAPAPIVVKDPAGDARPDAPDLTRAQLGLSSDRRIRIALTLAKGWVARDLIANSGPPGSLCVRMWTVSKPGAAPPDYLACITAREDAETTHGSVMKTIPNEAPQKVASAIVGRTSDRTVTLRFSQTAIGKPKTIQFAAEATKPGCARVSCVDTAPDAPKTATFRVRAG
jgi:hypothetical protein